MLRILVEIVLPLVLPTALYLVWLLLAQWAHSGGAVRWGALPWIWLAGAGVLLLVAMLAVVTVGFGTARHGAYVPPRWVGGHIIPGHIAKGAPP